MSALSDIKSYWQGNSTLTSALPLTSVWFGLVPPPNQQAFPYAVVETVSNPPQLTTGKGYYEEYHFQISLYGTALATLEGLADTVDGQFCKQPISGSVGMGCIRTNKVILTEQVTGQVVYHVVLEYLYWFNSTLP